MLISPLKNFKRSSSKGFTLVEILIVLAIFAGIAAMGVPALFKKSDNIKKVARKLTSLTKEVRSRAKLKNATYRIAIDMRAEPHRYWVEFMQGSKPIPANLYEEKEEDREAQSRSSRNFQKDNYDKGGLGNDHLHAFAQFGADTVDNFKSNSSCFLKCRNRIAIVR